MGRVGSRYDNAAAESWFALLKAEIGTTLRESREAARADVFRYVEVEYNRSRLRRHPDYGYVTPIETRSCSGRTSLQQRKHPLPNSRGNFILLAP